MSWPLGGYDISPMEKAFVKSPNWARNTTPVDPFLACVWKILPKNRVVWAHRVLQTDPPGFFNWGEDLAVMGTQETYIVGSGGDLVAETYATIGLLDHSTGNTVRWSDRLDTNATATNVMDVVVDSADYAYACLPGNFFNGCLYKISPDQQIVWAQDDFDDFHWATAVDGSGNVYAVGDGAEPVNWLVKKYDSDGRYVTRYDNGYWGVAVCVTLDHAGRICAVLWSAISGNHVCRFDSDLALLNNVGFTTSDVVAHAVAVDPQDRAFVATDCGIWGEDPDDPFNIVVMDEDGNIVTHHHVGDPDEQISLMDIVADGSGGFYVVGTRDTVNGANVWRIDANGNELWSYDTGTAAPGLLRGVDIDGAGGVYVCGDESDQWSWAA